MVRLRETLNELVTYRTFDIFITISRLLERHFAQRVRRSAKVLRIPILIDSAKWASVPPPIEWEAPTVAYMGNLSQESELRAVSYVMKYVARENRAARFAIAAPDEQASRVVNELSSSGVMFVETRIARAGLVAQSDVPNFLSNASVLILPRSSGLFADAGLPTKLAEYLASGRPVVTTNVGDIGIYLQDGQTAYLLAPDHLELFAERVTHILNNPAEATRVGSFGRKVALQLFSVDRFCADLLRECGHTQQ